MSYFFVYLRKLWLRIYIPILYKDKKQRKAALKQKTTFQLLKTPTTPFLFVGFKVWKTRQAS